MLQVNCVGLYTNEDEALFVEVSCSILSLGENGYGSKLDSNHNLFFHPETKQSPTVLTSNVRSFPIVFLPVSLFSQFFKNIYIFIGIDLYCRSRKSWHIFIA